MSTRSSRVYVSEGDTVMHLYDEMHDGETHLAIELEGTNLRLNLVIPEPLVEGVTAILQRADVEPHAKAKG